MSVSAVTSTGYINASFNQVPEASGSGATKEELVKLLTTLKAQDPTNAQGVVSIISQFDKIDLNRNSSLDSKELAIYKKSLRPPPDRRVLGDGITKQQLLSLDGKVTSAGEDDTAIRNLIESFEDADTNKDGKVDAEEIEALAKDKAAEERASGQDVTEFNLISPKELQRLLKLYKAQVTAPPAAEETTQLEGITA